MITVPPAPPDGPAPPRGPSPPPGEAQRRLSLPKSWPALPPLVEVVVVGMLVVVAALGFTPVFAGGAVVPLATVAAVPVLLSVGLAAPPRAVRLSLGLALWAVVTVVAAYGSVAEVASLAGGLRDGVQRLFTTALPVDSSGDELAIVSFLVAVASTAACELTMARRTGLLPALPPVLLLGAALVAGAGGRPMPRAVPALAVAGVGGLAVLRSMWRGGRANARLVVGVAVITGVAVAAATLGPHLPGARSRSRYDPRTAYAPVAPRPGVSPLVGFAASLAGPGETVFSVRAGPGVERWRLTTLDHFDGQLWTSAAAFRRAGRVLPEDPSVRVATDRLDQEVTIEQLEGYFLPGADRPAEMSVPGLGVDPSSGTLLVPRDRAVPRHYGLVSKLARPSPVQLRLAEAVPSEDAPDLQVPESLRQLAEQVARESPSAFGRMAALQDLFRGAGFTYDATAEAPSGHSLFHLGELMRKRRGTAEQYASAFAVLGLYLGYQTRVVVGYLPGQRDEATSTYRVRSTDLHAWPEVHFKDVGWVPFEPSPLGQLAGPADKELPTPLPAVEQAVRDELSDKGAGAGRRNRERRAPASEAGGGPAWVLIGMSVLGGSALFGPLAIMIAKALRRRRWRSAGPPGERVLGAWNEVVDRLRERRISVTTDMTADEVVGASASVMEVTPGALRSLSAAADAALYAGAALGQDAADAARRWVREVLAELDKGVPWWMRLRAKLSPAPLLARPKPKSQGSMQGFRPGLLAGTQQR